MNSYADQIGCLISSPGLPQRIYYQPTPGSPTNPPRYFTAAYYPTSCPAGSTPSTIYAVNKGTPVPPVSPNRCYGEYKGSGSVTFSENYVYNGVPISFDVANCPLDDYLPHLLFGSTMLGAFVLCRKQ